MKALSTDYIYFKLAEVISKPEQEHGNFCAYRRRVIRFIGMQKFSQIHHIYIYIAQESM